MPSDNAPRPHLVHPEFDRWLEMSSNDYRRITKRTALRRLGRVQLMRNAAIGLGNARSPAKVPVLARALGQAKSPVVRSHVAWALGQIGSDEARAALSLALETEQDDWVREELELALTPGRRYEVL
jgi:epoxyqueuosine reductase